MSQLNRYEFVGSFLRPERLKEARKNYELNNITKEELTKVEDECVVELVNKLKELGYHTITDGEFRRSTWHLDFTWGFEGVEHKKTVDGNQTFDGEAAMIDDTFMTGKISCKDHPFVEHFKFVKALEKYKQLLLDLNNKVVASAPVDLTINTHVCRGNYHSTYFSSGAYDGVADLLFGEENVDAYFLEYDDHRSGGFAPLKKISGDKKVVLGLITTKKPDLEDKELVKRRIYEATKYIPLERLYLSPQCGFASCEIGNKLTEEQQWAKLKLVKEIAEEVWG